MFLALVFCAVLPLLSSAVSLANVVLAQSAVIGSALLIAGCNGGCLAHRVSILTRLNFQVCLPILFLAFLEFLHVDLDSIRGILYLLFSVGAYLVGYTWYAQSPVGAWATAEFTGVASAGVLAGAYLLVHPSLNQDEGEFNSNYLGPIALCTGAFLWAAYHHRVKWFWPLFLLVFAMATITVTRSVLVGLAFGTLFVYGVRTTRWRFIALGFGVVIIAFALPLILTFLTDPQVNAVVMKYTGKNLETGRLAVWSYLMDDMNAETLFFGGQDKFAYTDEAAAKGFYIRGRTMHNGYFSLLARLGLLGLSMLLFSLVVLLKRISDNMSKYAKGCLVFFFAFVVREFFEVTLHANNFPIACLFWCFCGIVMSKLSAPQSDLRQAGPSTPIATPA